MRKAFRLQIFHYFALAGAERSRDADNNHVETKNTILMHRAHVWIGKK